MRTLIQSLISAIATPTLITLTISQWLVAGCAGTATPATLDVKTDQCATCRMVVSSGRMASQVVAPNQEPKFFDDLGCLDRFLAASTLPSGARVFVADHRTGEWVPAESAVFTRTNGAIGAMGSPFVAHATAASREADANAVGSVVPLTDALPTFRKPGGPQ
jgi:copper chaperone NosL